MCARCKDWTSAVFARIKPEDKYHWFPCKRCHRVFAFDHAGLSDIECVPLKLNGQPLNDYVISTTVDNALKRARVVAAIVLWGFDDSSGQAKVGLTSKQIAEMCNVSDSYVRKVSALLALEE